MHIEKGHTLFMLFISTEIEEIRISFIWPYQ